MASVVDAAAANGATNVGEATQWQQQRWLAKTNAVEQSAGGKRGGGTTAADAAT